jgi:hypothetical protein
MSAQKSPTLPAMTPILVRFNDPSMLRPRAFDDVPILVHRRVFGLVQGRSARMRCRNAGRHKRRFRVGSENGPVSDNGQYGQSKRVQH